MSSVARAGAVTSPLADTTSSSSQQDVMTSSAVGSAMTSADSRTVILEDIEVAVEAAESPVRRPTGEDLAESATTSSRSRSPDVTSALREVSPDPASPASTDTFHSIISQSAIEAADITGSGKAGGAQVQLGQAEVGQTDTTSDEGNGNTLVDLDPGGTKVTQGSNTSTPLPSHHHTQAHVRHVRISPPTDVSAILKQTPVIGPGDGADSQSQHMRASLGLNLQSQTAAPYPSLKLLSRLANENACIKLLKKLPRPMRTLACFSGEELVNFFHNKIARIGSEVEELQHVLWTMVTPYVNPSQEMITCVMLSSKALYFVSDDVPRRKRFQGKPTWKTHSRHASDTAAMTPSIRHGDHAAAAGHASPGLLLLSSSAGTESGAGKKETQQALPGKQHRGVARCYFSLELKELKQVNVGMFDQSFRLVGSNADQVFSCVTRDHALTETFVRQLMTSLSGVFLTPTPTPEDLPTAMTSSGNNSSAAEPDFYKMFNKYGRSESLAFTHPSRVKFMYPSEDAVSDLTYLVHEHIEGAKPALTEVRILLYLLVFEVSPRVRPCPHGTGDGDSSQTIPGDTEVLTSRDDVTGTPRTLILSSTHVCLALEDHVSYPLPDFVKGLPETPNYEVLEIRPLESLRRIVTSDFQSRDLTLVFPDEKEEIVVDTRIEHFTSGGSKMAASNPAPDRKWTLVIQNQRDRDRLLKLLCRQWSEMHDGTELSVQVSS